MRQPGALGCLPLRDERLDVPLQRKRVLDVGNAPRNPVAAAVRCRARRASNRLIDAAQQIPRRGREPRR
jgi:hypothetical protein